MYHDLKNIAHNNSTSFAPGGLPQRTVHVMVMGGGGVEEMRML